MIPPHIPTDPDRPVPVFAPPPPPRYYVAIVLISLLSGVVGAVGYAAFGPSASTILETRVERTVASGGVAEREVQRAQDSVVQIRGGASAGFGTALTSDGWVIAYGSGAARAKQIISRPSQVSAVTKVVQDPATGLYFLKIKASGVRVANTASLQDVERGTRMMIVLPHTAIPVTLQDASLCVSEKCPIVFSDKLSHAIAFVESIPAGVADGAPLMNAQGDLLGVVATIGGRTVGVPMDAIEVVQEKLFTTEVVRRPALGLRVVNATAAPVVVGERIVPRGFFVEAVTARYTTSVVLVGDVIDTWRGQPVEARASLFDLVQHEEIGARVPVVVVRNGVRMPLTLTIGSL